MIISASRRTDILAFYTEWFMNRIRAGFCMVPNPFNRKQVSRVSLKVEDVDVIAFWTRNPLPLFPFLEELDQLNFKYYFQFTVLGNPRILDPKAPPLKSSIHTFKELANRVGSKRMIWRYDPIVLSEPTNQHYHREMFLKIADDLQGATERCVISIVDPYPKARRRLASCSEKGLSLYDNEKLFGVIEELMPFLVQIASERSMELVSCAEDIDLRPFGVLPGKCIDDEYIKKVFRISVANKKDPSQRKECGCVVSKDIGMYDTCLYECQYCYATQSFDRAKQAYKKHKPDSESIIELGDSSLKPMNF